jgi:hypothetical protein
MLCLTVFGGAALAQAQIDSVTRIQADIPFNFTVGDTTLSAGKYELRRVDDLAENVLELSSVDGRARVIFDASPAQTKDLRPANRSELTFDKYGDQYFLSEIWVAGRSTGEELVRSRMEKRIAGGGKASEKHSIIAFLK